MRAGSQLPGSGSVHESFCYFQASRCPSLTWTIITSQRRPVPPSSTLPIMSNTDPETIIEDDVATPAVSVPESGDTGEGGKLKMIVGLVKKCLGVKDIASM